MDGSRGDRFRVALVDIDADGLDGFRRTLIAGGVAPEQARAAEVTLVIAPSPELLGWRWATLAGARRAGEVAALGETVLEAVVVDDRSPRAADALRLAASLGARALRFDPSAGEGS